MQLRHKTDRRYDLLMQMQELTRNTTDMLLSTLLSTYSDGGSFYMAVKDFIEMDWDDATHKVSCEFIPSVDPIDPDHTLLKITVKDGNTTMVLSVLLAHLHTKYHIRYIPGECDVDVTSVYTYDSGRTETYEMSESGGVALAVLRCLAIQLGVHLAIENNIYANTIDEFRADGMPESDETPLLLYGISHLMDLIKDAAPTD